jgi:hypothetical protein
MKGYSALSLARNALSGHRRAATTLGDTFIASTSQLSGTKTKLFGNKRVSNAFFICTS